MKKIPLVSIGVQRDGKTIYPEIGKPFDFTVNELADLDKLAAETKDDYYRDPVNEVAAAPAQTGNDVHAKTIEVVTALLADAANLNGEGNLKMDVLTDALKAVDLPKASAADRDPVNEVAAVAAAPAQTGNDVHAKTIEVITALLADAANLNGEGNLKMDVLTDALKAVNLPKASAADRDAFVAEIKNEI